MSGVRTRLTVDDATITIVNGLRRVSFGRDEVRELRLAESLPASDFGAQPQCVEFLGVDGAAHKSLATTRGSRGASEVVLLQVWSALGTASLRPPDPP